ncbi:carboxymuconolactone decarboxylase family protein [Sporosarcina jeotgali]|uniref:Carboxymuconolactone decarboxylase family protein n=1 Tax=Sporosarcina jeotgali TaxID=3020056 RepID=A0ABZ0KU74_9BACL|nr:carboxymuconolactone decarboxylase family protein [Sporosarcina sp. B2O-1]WOV83023.1 carboxymuconolactone decarboxylase family protein [Sporosarcina sp. B2O-1]
MEPRVSHFDQAPDGMSIMLEMEKYIKTTAIEQSLQELIKIRASQINGCAYCLNMHTADARKIGEAEQRISCISAWDDCDFYTESERAALELTEHVTLVSAKRVPDDLYKKVRLHFNEKQYVDLILIINQINNWNRISIAMGIRSSEK